jgi:hypothetical protein
MRTHARTHSYGVPHLFAGTISLKNLRRVAKELGENMTDDELQEVIDFCDKDGRGEILLEDFCSVLLQAQAQQQLCAATARPHAARPRPTSERRPVPASR